MSDYAEILGERNLLRLSRLARRKGWRVERACAFVAGLLTDPGYRDALRFEAEKYNQTEAECFRSVVSLALDELDIKTNPGLPTRGNRDSITTTQQGQKPRRNIYDGYERERFR